MTPKEKAKELVDKYECYADGVDRQEDNDQIEEHLENIKQCALIAVDEVLKSLDSELLDLFSSGRNCPINHKHKEYWQQVKHELTKQQEQ